MEKCGQFYKLRLSHYFYFDLLFTAPVILTVTVCV